MNYLSSLYANASTGLIQVVSLPDAKSWWFDIDALDEAEALMIEVGKRNNVYHTWALQKDRPLGDSRNASNACGLPGFMLDIDINSQDDKVHARSKDLPGSWEEMLDHLLDVGFTPPSAIRHSGNGAYFDWLFVRPWEFQDPDERDAAQHLARRFERAARSAAKAKAWHIDSVSDFARITRLPGTYNHKTEVAKPVQLLRYDPAKRLEVGESSSLIDRLEIKFGSTISASRAISDTPSRLTSANRAPTSSKATADFEAIRTGCRWVNSICSNADRIPEPDWHALAGILAGCKDGNAKFHQISSKDERYDPAEAEEKFQRADKEAPPRRCDTIEGSLGFSGCRECPFSANPRVQSPISLGYGTPVVNSLMAENVFDISTQRFFNIRSGTALDERAFSSKHRHETDRSAPSSLLISDKHTLKVARTDYIPGTKAPYITCEQDVVLNTWKPSSLVPTAGNYEIISEHLSYLIPSRESQEHLLDVLAHSVQHPDRKIRHVMLLIGRQGTGKSFLISLLKAIYGDHNLFTAESSDLTSDWTAQMGNRQCLVLEELGVFERREVYEKLKRWVTDETVSVNEKHVRKYLARTPKIIIGFSNHDSPIALAEDDRRFWVYRSPTTPKDSAYYDRLFTEGVAQVGSFFQALLDRDVSQFSADAAPPITEAKLEIIQKSRPMNDQELRSMIEAEEYPFDVDLVSLSNVRDHLSARLKGRAMTTPDVQKLLTNLGGRFVREVRHGSTGRARLWAWKNVDRWTAATPEELRQELGRTSRTI